MARARNIKPGFFKNADLVELSVEARLLFIGLWTLADRAGRLEDRPKQIKMELFPADSVDVDACLDGLQKWGFVTRYEVAGKRLIQVVNFEKHQHPHRDEKVSVLPGPDATTDEAQCKHGASTVQAPCTDDANTGLTRLNPDSLNLNPESLNLNPESPIPAQAPGRKSAKPVAPDGYTEEFESAWRDYPQRPGHSKAEAFRAWKARIADGVDPSVMAEGVARYAAYCKAEGIEPKFVKHAATFFGPDLHFDSDWAPSSPVEATKLTGNYAELALPSRPKWALDAGFANRFEANNDGCFEHNAAKFRDGKKVVA
jgi:hypothetical protein